MQIVILIKRAVSARIKFYRKRYKIIRKILCRFKILRYEISNLKFTAKFHGEGAIS